MATEDPSENPYQAPPAMEVMAVAKASEIAPHLTVKWVLLCVLYSVIFGIGLAFVFAVIGRSIAIATFDLTPSDSFESEHEVNRARISHITLYSLSFTVTGLFFGVLSPWVYWLCSNLQKERLMIHGSRN